jgi:hypothetical protein
MERDQRARDAREALAARREHSKGQGNFPRRIRPPRDVIGERPADRQPRDLRKEYDPRSAPKGNATSGQADRNPDLELRDEAIPEMKGAGPASGFERALATTENEIVQRHAEAIPKRPLARRAAAAKREAKKRTAPRRQHRAEREMVIRQAPKSSARTAKKAAAERRPQVGTRKTGTARTRKPKTVVGSRAGRGT